MARVAPRVLVEVNYSGSAAIRHLRPQTNDFYRVVRRRRSTWNFIENRRVYHAEFFSWLVG